MNVFNKKNNKLSLHKKLSLCLVLSTISFSAPQVAYSAEGASGFAIPRFVSLRTNEANVRTGPGMQYPKKWVLVKRHIPLEIISEYQDWRKVRDVQNDEGWVHKAMLSGNRTSIVRANSAKIFSDAAKTQEIAVLENGVNIKLDSCEVDYCVAKVNGEESEIKGYISKLDVWGAYQDEVFD